MSEKNPVIKVKVKPYPISVEVTGGKTPVKGKVLKLTLDGMLVDIGNVMLTINDRLTSEFTLPALKIDLKIPVKVIKFHDRALEGRDPLSNKPAGMTVQRFTEFHYLSLSDKDKKYINDFLVTIKQI